MKKLKSTMPNMILSLGLITALSGALLGYVYSITAQPIAESVLRQQQQAIAEVTPPFDNNPELDKREYNISGSVVTVYPAKKGNVLQGAAVKATSMNGFSGEVTVMCGFDADGAVINYRVLKQAETPGLGAKMEMWFRDPAGARSVIGKNPGEVNFYVTKDKEQEGEVDGITAATISSRAFLETLRHGYEAYVQYAEKEGVVLKSSNASEHSAEASTGASRKK